MAGWRFLACLLPALLPIAAAQAQSPQAQPTAERVDRNTIVVRDAPPGSLSLFLDPRILLSSLDPTAIILHGTGPMVRNLLHIVRGEVVPRTFRGQKVSPGELPWQVALVDAASTDVVNGIFCGGTLISERWILTAAHCMVDSRASRGRPHPSRFYIMAGETAPNENARRLRARRILVHAPWLDGTQIFDRDLSLIELEEPIRVSSTIRPVALPSSNDTALMAEGQDVLVAGWGYTEQGKNSPDLLRANVTVRNHQQCSQAPGYSQHVTANMFCAAAPGADTCSNDSGGPVISTAGQRPTLIGVTSFGGLPCANPTYPGVYVRISRYLAWIADTMRS